MDVIRLIGFTKSPDLIAGIRKGFFSEQGIDLQYVQTTGSAPQIRGLLAGEWELAQTAVDNVLAYVDGENAPIFVVLVADVGNTQKVVVRPKIGSLSDLKGKVVGLDHLTTGYAFMLYKILALNGVSRADYEAVSVGGTAERLQAMLDGKIEAALLSAPFDQRAEAAGCRVITACSSYFPGYPGATVAATRRWADAHPELLVRFCRSYLKAVRWAAEPENQTALVQAVADEYGQNLEQAQRLAEAARRDREGVVTSLDQMRRAITVPLALRREMTGGDAKANLQLDRYLDASYVLRADPGLNRS